MSELMRLDEEYRNWIQELGDRYRTSQIKASIRVNNEMLMYYWSVGKDITERRADSKWGNKFFQNMSMDMSDMIPNAKGFSPTNLRYMMRFYGLYKDIVIVPQVGERLLENNGNQIVPQVEEQFEMASNKVFMIPWGHINIMDNRKEQLSELSRKVQKSLDETKKSCNELVNRRLIEIVGKEYMLTAKVYEALKSDVEYIRDKMVQYIKTKNMILE